MGRTHRRTLIFKEKEISSKSFTLTELIIAVVLLGLVFLAVTSVDITSRRFFGTASKESWIQDEAKISMEHIVKNIQPAIGDMTDPTNSKGFYIYNNGAPVKSGSRIRVKRDGINGAADGRYDPNDPNDGEIGYEYKSINHSIYFYPDANNPSNYEVLAEGIVKSTVFAYEDATPNQVKVVIEVLRDPEKEPSLKNPKTILSSTVILRSMSAN